LNSSNQLHYLDGNQPIEVRIFGAVDFADASGAKFSCDAVVGWSCANHCCARHFSGKFILRSSAWKRGSLRSGSIRGSLYI
jgi:hypothetical protein